MIWMCVNLAVGAATVFCAYGGMISPLHHTFPSIAAMTFPGWLIVSLALVGLNLWKARRTAMVNIVALLICWGPIATICPLHKAQEAEGATMTLMSYNVLHLLDFSNGSVPAADNPTLKFILDKRPGVVALQECYSPDFSGNKRISKSLTDTLHAAYPYRTAGGEGQALLSRYPFEEIKLHYAPSSGFQVRAYRIDSPLGKLTLFNIHLQSIGLTDDDKELYRQLTDGRAAKQPIKQELRELRYDVMTKLSAAFRRRAVQAARVKELVDSVGGTVIVCGDFNDIPGCYACREIMSAGLTDAYAASGFGPAITYHASRFFFRIDHIFYSSDLKSLWTRKETNPTSDHYPIVSCLTLNPMSEEGE